MSDSIKKKLSKNRFFLILILIVAFAVGGTLVFSILEGDNENHYFNGDNKEDYQKVDPYDSFALETMKTQLIKNNIDTFVISIKENTEKRILAINYQTKSEEDVSKQEIALIAGTFIGIKKYNNWDVSRLEATIKNKDEGIEGTWHIAEDWIEDYIGEKITDESLVSKIINSYQSI